MIAYAAGTQAYPDDSLISKEEILLIAVMIGAGEFQEKTT
jgi:hypothetical protein